MRLRSVFGLLLIALIALVLLPGLATAAGRCGSCQPAAKSGPFANLRERIAERRANRTGGCSQAAPGAAAPTCSSCGVAPGGAVLPAAPACPNGKCPLPGKVGLID